MGDVLLLLAFSGGGTRAAALSYGVLQELRDTRVVVGGVEKRLLDEVDLITSVSGGSFTSAYYALYGDRIFADFEPRFLRRNIQRRLLLELVRPRHWIRLASTFYNFETLELLGESLKTWADEILPEARGRRVQTYVLVVAFESVEDSAERAYFNALSTSFHLDGEAVDRVMAVGRCLLRGSPEFQRLMATLQAEARRSPFETMTSIGRADNAASGTRASPRDRP
jgi:hypothetical protein